MLGVHPDPTDESVGYFHSSASPTFEGNDPKRRRRSVLPPHSKFRR
jgi:hypothetical protein